MLFIIVTNDEVFFFCKKLMLAIITFWFIGGPQDMLRRGCLVVERRTPEREVSGSILTQVAVLFP